MSCDGQLTAGGTVWEVCSGGNFTGNFSWGMSVGILWGNVGASFWKFSGGEEGFLQGKCPRKNCLRCLSQSSAGLQASLHSAVMT